MNNETVQYLFMPSLMGYSFAVYSNYYTQLGGKVKGCLLLVL